MIRDALPPLQITNSGAGPVALRNSSRSRLRPATSSAVGAGFWRQRQDTNGAVAIVEAYDRLVEAGNLANLRVSAGLEEGDARGPYFMDSDIYKWLEAVAWEYARNPNQRLLELQREVTALVALTQEADGYLDSVVRIRHHGERYTHLIRSHELYCAGHLFQAAVAQSRSTPDRALLDVAVKFADHLVRTFGADKLVEIDGHPIIEMALVELYRETGTADYLELAEFFVEARGHGILKTVNDDSTYFSDRLPVRELESFEGHSVRAVYFAAGAADVALETGDQTLWSALDRQFDTTWERKTYITGGLGSRWEGESFGDGYELPSDRAYAETCAAIGGIQFAWRMLLGTSDVKYADAIERLLYNAFLPGVSLGGNEYFYVNALQLRTGAEPDNDRSPAHGRRAWFDVACCPPNIMRTFASLNNYVLTSDAAGLQLHQFVAGRFGGALESGAASVSVESDYPRSGSVSITVDETVDGSWTLAVRVPGWAEGVSATVIGGDGTATPIEQLPSDGYLRIERDWSVGERVQLEIPFESRILVPDERIDALRQSLAVERGPLVYCAEHVDQPGLVDDVVVASDAALRSDWAPELLGGVNIVELPGKRAGCAVQPKGALPYYGVGVAREDARDATEPEDVAIRLVPYYAWGNREIGPMRVWLRRSGRLG